MSDELVLDGVLIATSILLHGLYDITESLYWKFIDWRSSRERKQKGDG